MLLLYFIVIASFLGLAIGNYLGGDFDFKLVIGMYQIFPVSISKLPFLKLISVFLHFYFCRDHSMLTEYLILYHLFCALVCFAAEAVWRTIGHRRL